MDTSITSGVFFIYNNIFFNNTATGNGSDILVSDFGFPFGLPVNLFNNIFSGFFSHCDDNESCTPNISMGSNINRDPLFVDASNGNIHIQRGSPAIDTGTASAPARPTNDFEGDPRIIDAAPDIGADEHNPVRPTPVGTNITVQADSVKITFPNVTTMENTTVTPIDPTTAGTPPSRFQFGAGLPAFEIRTAAAVTGPITVCIQILTVTDLTRFNMLRILHGEGGPMLVDRTILPPNSPAPDFSTKTICARVTALSPFVVAELVDAVVNVNDLVTFTPLPGSFRTNADTTGCGPGSFVGTFRFEATLTNETEESSLSQLHVQVTTLTNGNVLQNADEGPGGVGATLTPPQTFLSPGDSERVLFVICLTNSQRFRFFVDVFGFVE